MVKIEESIRLLGEKHEHEFEKYSLKINKRKILRLIIAREI
jgi:hypothetical protein